MDFDKICVEVPLDMVYNPDVYIRIGVVSIMIRTQIYLSKEEREGLQVIARDKKKSQSEIIREAVDEYIKKEKRGSKLKIIQTMNGVWKDRTELPDFKTLRGEWDRGISNA